ncbi:hypothetical protein CHS0354_033873 [Potamilus streckersoni]|uniref:Pseudouridine synthase RsuA/RluA-like domain-containing protein n=1 Tax=Potamilus streckersoni TaxID=2493646 RepID=A0AAE0VLH0_9BIVA|nr:hypothetical protein CHS0354_033873 [Potamilus streckersoni]
MLCSGLRTSIRLGSNILGYQLTVRETRIYLFGFLVKSVSSSSQMSLITELKNKGGTDVETAQLSKRAQKRLKRLNKVHEQKTCHNAPIATLPDEEEGGFTDACMRETEYYFENGLRKVYPYYYTFSTYVKERWFGRTVLDVLGTEFRSDSREAYKERIDQGLVTVNGKSVTADFILGQNQLLAHTLHRHENPVWDQKVQIISDTPDIMVINKPSSIPCHPCGRYRHNSIIFILAKEYGYHHLKVLHRLDRLTSGVLIIPKTLKTSQKMETQLAKRQIQKEYVCRVEGEFPDGIVECKEPLEYLSHKIGLIRVSPKGKHSSTTFEKLSFNGKSSVVRCVPFTGRTHQIRVHLQFLGYPILNDPFYNSTAFGSQKGKGGIFERSQDEIVEELTKHHNVGMWIKGKNTLFKKRIEELKATQNKDKSHHSQSASEESTAGQKCIIPAVESGNLQTCDNFSNNFLNVEDEPPSKKARSVINTCTMGKESEEETHKSLTVNTAKSTMGNSVTPCDERSTDSHKSNLTLIPSETVNMSTKHNVTDEKLEVHVNVCQSDKHGHHINRNGFDWSKWIPDEHCQDCQMLFVDPEPKDLIMYLHALKYKGPDWEYESELPEWALPDWKEPDTEN